MTVQENASIEREKMVVAAQVETAKPEAAAGVAKTNAAVAVTIIGEAPRAQTETARIVANPQTEGSNTLAIGEMLSEPGSATFEDDSQS